MVINIYNRQTHKDGLRIHLFLGNLHLQMTWRKTPEHHTATNDFRMVGDPGSCGLDWLNAPKKNMVLPLDMLAVAG